MSRLISRNPYSKKETFWHDNNDGTYTIETKQHIKEVLDANKRKSNDYEKGSMITFHSFIFSFSILLKR